MEMEGDFVKFSPTKSSMSLTFDTVPESYYMDYSKPYFTMVLKTSEAFSGSLFVKTLDSKYCKEFPIEFTGEWQKLILDFSDGNGWTVRDENKEYQPYYKTPFSKALQDNLSMFCETMAEYGYPTASKTKGYLYINCDDGNPGEIFNSIEFMPSMHMITAQSSDYNFKNTFVENLCVMYGGAHGIHASTATNFTVKNCELAGLAAVYSLIHTQVQAQVLVTATLWKRDFATDIMLQTIIFINAICRNNFPNK